MYTLQGLLVLAACIGITFYGFKRQQRQREKILAAENEKQQQALQMLTTAALAVENGNKATAEQLLQKPISCYEKVNRESLKQYTLTLVNNTLARTGSDD